MNNVNKLNKKEKITNSIVTKLLAEKEMYQHHIERFEKELALLPEGSLTRKVINDNVYFYQTVEDEKGNVTQKYLSKNENDFVSAIKRRHFVQKSLKRLYSNIKAMDTFLEKFNPYDATDVASKLPKVYLQSPEISPYGINKNSSEQSWQDMPYKNNKLFPENLTNNTPGGRKVRSKSEAIIAASLENKNIPFRYEAELILGDQTYYPDFTILKPRDGEIIYWEHFGMTKNSQYSISMEQKLILYTRYNIIPWDNLIITFDSKNSSIDAQIIKNIINTFIL
jgi:hypothetical protein